ncbi:hypothetical protein MBLNU459_g0223t2 [Dothideomycetes sp. NU459]
MPSDRLHPSAQSGFSNAADYDKHRPSFPPESVDVLLDNLRVKEISGATVVDLAAGTGKYTELLAERPEQFNVVAIEPHADMRKVLEEKKLSTVDIKDGLSTSMPLEDESVDAVIAAQAFHWFSNVESLREINRVLQPHGVLGMTWNIEDYNAPRSQKAATAWEETLHDIIWSLDDNAPRFRHEKWRQVFDEQLESNPLSIATSAEPLFSLPLGEHIERWEIWLTKEAVWDRFNTLSHVAMLEGEEKQRIHKIFTDAINGKDVETNDKGEVAVHGMTISAWTTKIPTKGATSIMTTVKDAIAGRT